MRDLNEFTHVSRRTAAQSAQGERGPDENRPAADQFRCSDDLVDGIARHGLADGQIDRFADLIEQLTVFCLVDSVQIRTDEFDVEALKRPVVGKFTGDVQRGLTAHAGEQSARALLLQNLGNGFGKQGFDVDDVGHLGVVLDGCGVGIDQDDLVAILTKRTNSL